MNKMINDQDISATVRDFETLCSYIVANKPALTPGGALGKKACFEMNSNMAYPVPDAKITHQMNKYPSIILYLTIALESGLLEPGLGTGKKAAITTTELYAAYQKMNKYSKYLFIFLAWIRYIDADALYGSAMNRRWFDASLIERTLDLAGNTQAPGAVYQRKHQIDYYSADEPLQHLMNRCLLLLHHFRDLGLIGYKEEDTEKPYYYLTVVNKVWFTELGGILSAACSARRFSWINVLEDECVFYDDDEEVLYDNDFKQNPPGSAGFLKPFAACFPENEIDTDAINQLLFPQSASPPDNLVYEFRVTLGRNCYREIQCWGCHSFEALHLAIQDAFNFDNDHLYAFFLDGKKWSRRSVNSPYGNELPYADDVLICEAGLRVRQRILYVFDFGDEWRFDVTLLSIHTGEDAPEYPVVMKSVGESPEQYPSYDDNDDDFYEE